MSVLVKDAMTSDVVTLEPHLPIARASERLAVRGLSGAPVVGHDGRPVGFLSVRDLTDPSRYLVTQMSDATVGDVMTPMVLTTTPTTPIVDAARLLVADGIHHLVVMEGRQLVGILSTMDIVRALVDAAAAVDTGDPTRRKHC